MQQLHYPAEIRPIADVGIETSGVQDAELELAKQLIAQSTVQTFSPAKYTDEVRERVEGLIAKKVDGEDITAPVESTRAQVIDLMTALKESLGAGDGAENPENDLAVSNAAASGTDGS